MRSNNKKYHQTTPITYIRQRQAVSSDLTFFWQFFCLTVRGYLSSLCSAGLYLQCRAQTLSEKRVLAASVRAICVCMYYKIMHQFCFERFLAKIIARKLVNWQASHCWFLLIPDNTTVLMLVMTMRSVRQSGGVVVQCSILFTSS